MAISKFKYEYGVCVLQDFPAIHGFTTANAGNMSYNHGRRERVDEVRGRVYSVLGINPDNVVEMEVEHVANAYVVENADKKAVKADALMTSKPGLALALTVGDCLPIYVADIDEKAILQIHAGKKGTEAGITQKSVEFFLENFNIKPRQLKVLIGPGICARCYGKDILSPNIEQLKSCGVDSKNIIAARLCTCCSRIPPNIGPFQFPSHFRWRKLNNEQGPDARFMALIAKS